MKSLNGLTKFCFLKIQSNKHDKLTNLINVIKLLKENNLKVTNTSQLYIKESKNDLISLIKLEYNNTDLHNHISSVMNTFNKNINSGIIMSLIHYDKELTTTVNHYQEQKNKLTLDESYDLSSDGLNKVIGIYKENNSILLDYKKTYIMSIVNCTNDSFSEGGLLKNYKTENSISDYQNIIKSLEEREDCIDFIDIGGESTRPGSKEVEPNEELERILPLIRMIKTNDKLKKKIISIDTRKSLVASIALKEGAHIINDVSGGKYDSNMLNVVAESNCPYICMHMRGNTETMSSLNKYNNIINEVISETEENLRNCWNNNILNFNLWVDPGFGFSKIGDQNYHILDKLNYYRQAFSNTLVIGTSRKSFIRRVIGDDTRVGDAVVTAHCVGKGANVIRCHDVKEMRRAVTIAEKIYKYSDNKS